MRLIRFEFEGKTQWGVEKGGLVFTIEGDVLDEFLPGKELASLDRVKLLAPWDGGI
jgi:hypothetical protein